MRKQRVITYFFHYWLFEIKEITLDDFMDMEDEQYDNLAEEFVKEFNYELEDIL